MIVKFDPIPDQVLDKYWDRDQVLANRIEDAIDLIRDGDTRARRRAFSGGIFAIDTFCGDHGYLVLWEMVHGEAYVRFIGRSDSL